MIKKELTSWSDGVLMICTKCGKKIPASSLKENGEPAENLKIDLKKRLKESGKDNKVRVITSSCLNVCVDGTQAVCFASTTGKTECFTVHPEEDRNDLIELINSKMS